MARSIASAAVAVFVLAFSSRVAAAGRLPDNEASQSEKWGEGRVIAVPYVGRFDLSAQGARRIDRYQCDAENFHPGPETVYRVDLRAPARLLAHVKASAEVHADVHILTSMELLGREAQTCVARGDGMVEADLPAGRYFVVVDTGDSIVDSGSIVVRVLAIGDAWMSFPIGEGVLWRARRGAGVAGPQVLHMIEADLRVEGVELRPDIGRGCQTVQEVVQSSRWKDVVAATNASFFGECRSHSYVQIDGVIVAEERRRGRDHGAIGIDSSGHASFRWRRAGQAWPEVRDAQGGVPTLVVDGVARAGRWSEEGLKSESFLGRNPRTVLGRRGEHTLVLATVDGRRGNARGMSLDELATWSVDALGLSDAINLDGGGSTTMWVRGMTPGGVVNYPSDRGFFEAATHPGARAVVGVLLIRARPARVAPVIVGLSSAVARTGGRYRSQLWAQDLEVDDVLRYSLVSGPQGMTVGELNGEISYPVPLDVGSTVDFRVRVTDSRNLYAEQAFKLKPIRPSAAEASAATGDPRAEAATADQWPVGLALVASLALLYALFARSSRNR